MKINSVWPAVALASVCLVCVTVLLALHVDTTVIVSVLTMVAVPVMGAIIYGKVDTVEKQTNGNTTRQQATIDGLIDHLKQHNAVAGSVPDPLKEEGTV